MVAGAIINAEYEWKIKYLQTSEENLKKERPKFKEKKKTERERERIWMKKTCQRRKGKI